MWHDMVLYRTVHYSLQARDLVVTLAEWLTRCPAKVALVKGGVGPGSSFGSVGSNPTGDVTVSVFSFFKNFWCHSVCFPRYLVCLQREG